MGADRRRDDKNAEAVLGRATHRGCSFAGRDSFAGVGTGHLKPISAPAEGIIARQREVKPLVELRVPFELSRPTIDDVERGSDDSDWQPAKDAAKKLAFAEDLALFNGYREEALRRTERERTR